MGDIFPTIYVSDMARSLAFYRDVLGLRPGYAWPSDAALPEFIVLSAEGGGQLGLSPYGVARELMPGVAIGAGPAQFELALSVPDVDAAFARLTAAGATVVKPPQNRPWGERMCYCQDPDGHLLHLYAPINAATGGDQS